MEKNLDWLKKSELYITLSDNDEGDLDFLNNLTESCELDFSTKESIIKIFKAIRFFGVFEIPKNVFEYCYNNDTSTYFDDFSEIEIKDLFGLFPLLYLLKDTQLIKNYIRLDLYKFFISSSEKLLKENLHIFAADQCKLNCLKILGEKIIKKFSDIIMISFLESDLECLEGVKYIDSFIKKNTRNYNYYAAKYNKLNTLKFLINTKKYNTDEICNGAALSGNIEILKYAVKNGYPKNKSCLLESIRSKNLECIKYILKNSLHFQLLHKLFKNPLHQFNSIM